MSGYEDEHAPDEAEIAAAEALRKALDEASESDDADFARALALANAPARRAELSDAENAALLSRAYDLAAARARNANEPNEANLVSITARPRRWARVAAVASVSALALAAGVALFFGAGDRTTAESPVAVASGVRKAVERSTEPLFSGSGRAELHASNTSPSSGSRRIDRIARVRDAEFLEARIDGWQLHGTDGR